MTKAVQHFPGVEPDSTARREFLKRTGALSVLASATPWAATLAAMSEAAAQTATDYKAIVCIFLAGGNDYANTILPYDHASYSAYNRLRANIALPHAALTNTLLTPITPLSGERSFALAPTLAPLLPIFNAGALNVLLNVGTLVQPTSKNQFTNRSVALPPKLFSHNDQQSYWQSSAPEGAQSGWGGRMGDLLGSRNGSAAFTCVSVAGNAVYLSGQHTAQYQVSTSGPIPVRGIESPLFGSTACSTLLSTLMKSPRTQLLEDTYATITARAVNSYGQLSTALASSSMNTVFPPTGIGAQLAMVAKMIAARTNVGVRRQVFFVQVGGFDTHENMGAVNGPHALLLGTVGAAMAAFYQATKDMGVSSQVTSFTASDFGRTLNSNTGGSDHGWGSMHLVMGDGVKGKSFTGTAPMYGDNEQDDVGQGRLLPTTSVDQLGATLGKWFGVSSGGLYDVMPNIGNYTTQDLGFMKT
jgi:uncharacterized protein (DUF1501 family)